jgi:hypothetical protein
MSGDDGFFSRPLGSARGRCLHLRLYFYFSLCPEFYLARFRRLCSSLGFIFLISVIASATRIVRPSIGGGGNRQQVHGRNIVRHVWSCLLALDSRLYDPRTRNCSRIEPASCGGDT